MGRLRNTRGRNRRVTSVRERLRDAVGRVPAAFASLLPTVMLFGATALLPALAPATWEYLSSSPYLAVREVLVEGTRRLTPELVEDLVRTNSSGRILRLDEEALLEDLAQTGWVKEARIRRIPPGTVLVRLTENQPVATVLASGAHLVDRDGVPFRHVQPGERLTRPVLTGISNPASGLGRRALRRAIALVNDYRLSGMPRFDRLAEVHRDPARGYSLVTERHKMVLHLGHEAFQTRIKRARLVVADYVRSGRGVPAEVHAYLKQDKVVVTPRRKSRDPSPAGPAGVRIARDQ